MNPKILLALFAGLVLGLAGGYALAPTDASATELSSVDDGAEASNTTPSEPAPTPEPLLVEASDDRRVVPERTQRLAPVVPANAVAEAAERAPARADFEPSGTGVVTGDVVDVSGAPVPGVTVYASAYGESRSSREALISRAKPRVLESVDEALERAADAWSRSRERTAIAVTDADGAFTLEGLDTSARLSLNAYHEDFIVPRPRGEVVDGAEIRLTARRPIPIDFEVVDASGAPVPAASIALWTDSGDELVDWSASAPALTLLEGSARVRAALEPTADARWRIDELKQFARAVSEQVSIEVTPGVGAVRLQLVESDALVVVLETVEELPSDFSSWLTVVEEGEDPRYGGGEQRSVRGGETTHVFGGLAKGAYTVRLADWGEASPMAEVGVVYEGGSQEIVLPVPALERMEPLRVRVLDSAGAPVDGCDFSRRVEREGGSSSSGLQADSTGDGWWRLDPRPAYRVRGVETAPEEGTTVSLRVRSTELGETDVELVEGVFEYEVVFPAVASVEVVVAGWSGGGDARVDLRQVEDGGDDPDVLVYHARGAHSKAVGSDGVVHLEPVGVGLYRAVLLVDRVELASAEVQVVEGENRVTLVPKASYEVVVHCPNLPEGTQVSLAVVSEDGPSFGGWHREDVDDSGYARFDSVLEGRYQLRAGMHAEQIEVPCGTITVDAKLPNAIRVSVYEEDGPLANLGFADGDVVFGIDGVAFAGMEEVRLALRELGSEALTLMVDRDGEVIELVTEVTGTSALGGVDLGGAVGFVTRD